MDHTRPRILFFTGTDTDVGKTYVAALAIEELRNSGKRIGVYKPVASGCIAQGDTLISSDAVRLWESSGRSSELNAVCPQRFLAPLAPPSAAKLEGKTVDETLLLGGIDSVCSGMDLVVAEGAGGLMSPLSENLLNSDFARRLDAHVVIVAANRLGAIHQVLATVTAASALRLPVVGIVLNQVTEASDLSVSDNATAISKFTSVPLLGQISFGATASGIDWTSLPSPREVSTQIAQAWL
jgi:dethiobiotin synthetase